MHQPYLFKVFIFSFCLLSINFGFAQENEKDRSFKFQFDSRRTFVDKKSVGIFGYRGGISFNNKYEVGIGIYGSRIFDFLGKKVAKNYLDKSFDPPELVPAEIGFEYVSIYGEYVVLQTNRLTFTANTQLGIGRVNILLIDPDGYDRTKREGKLLVEHSIKAKVQTFKWLNVIGGVGYRYLVAGEDQIKDAFNAPIYIVNLEFDFKKIFQLLKKKK